MEEKKRWMKNVTVIIISVLCGIMSQFFLHKVYHISQKHYITVTVETEYFYILLSENFIIYLFICSIVHASFYLTHFLLLLLFEGCHVTNDHTETLIGFIKGMSSVWPNLNKMHKCTLLCMSLKEIPVQKNTLLY